MTDRELFEKARKGKISILSDPRIDKIKNKKGEQDTPLHELAYSGAREVLKHPSVDCVFDRYKRTPLHYLALTGAIEVLKHPSVDKVPDANGENPLHFLARAGNLNILNHPSVDKVPDANGNTPLNFLAWSSKLTLENLKEKYPWFNFKNKKFNQKLVNEIINTPQSTLYIKGL